MKGKNAELNPQNMILRICEIEVFPEYVDEYIAAGKEVARDSMVEEPGVICMLPLRLKEDGTQFRVVKVYGSQEIYEQHIQTDHFLKYKTGTLHMVKSLKLMDSFPTNPDGIAEIFRKMPQ